MASAGDALRTALGKAVLQGTANTYTSGGTLWLALGTACTSTAGITEVPNANNYSRTAIVSNATNWPEDGTTKGKFSNGQAITTATASGSWGTPTFFALCNNATYATGTALVWNAIDSNAVQSIGNGQFGNFAIGSLVITFT